MFNVARIGGECDDEMTDTSASRCRIDRSRRPSGHTTYCDAVTGLLKVQGSDAPTVVAALGDSATKLDRLADRSKDVNDAQRVRTVRDAMQALLALDFSVPQDQAITAAAEKFKVMPPCGQFAASSSP